MESGCWWPTSRVPSWLSVGTCSSYSLLQAKQPSTWSQAQAGHSGNAHPTASFSEQGIPTPGGQPGPQPHSPGLVPKYSSSQGRVLGGSPSLSPFPLRKRIPSPYLPGSGEEAATAAVTASGDPVLMSVRALTPGEAGSRGSASAEGARPGESSNGNAFKRPRACAQTSRGPRVRVRAPGSHLLGRGGGGGEDGSLVLHPNLGGLKYRFLY